MRYDRISGRRIMVVEDEYHIAQELRRGLHAASAVVLGPVPSVSAAMELLRQRPDAAVLDINLCGELAYSVADALTATGVPFLFATGYDQSTLPSQYASLVHLQKPVEMATLLRELDRLLDLGPSTGEAAVAPHSTHEGQPREILVQIVDHFTALVTEFDRTISAYGGDDNDPDRVALSRARKAAQRGLELVRSALLRSKP